jgi:hypothetical protein
MHVTKLTVRAADGITPGKAIGVLLRVRDLDEIIALVVLDGHGEGKHLTPDSNAVNRADEQIPDLDLESPLWDALERNLLGSRLGSEKVVDVDKVHDHDSFLP